jgi:hypothetical protein
MQMVGHIVYGNQLVPLRGDDAGDVFLQFVIVFRRDEILPAFNGKNDVQINLRVGICHSEYIAPTELKLFLFCFYKDFGPTGLSFCIFHS